jgi:DNA-directed RNA polymerase specialized sigma24 family protein
MEDKKIIELYFARNESAIAETDRKYGAYCRAIAYRILEDRLDSEEVANDTYLRLWNSIPPQKPNPLKPYVGRISRNLALDIYDAKNAKKRRAVTLALEELAECLPAGDGREIGDVTVHYSEIFDGSYHSQAKFVWGGDLYVIDVTSKEDIHDIQEYLDRIFKEK